MADYGVIGTDKGFARFSAAFFRADAASCLRICGAKANVAHNVQLNPSRKISGVVKENGSGVARVVRAYNRGTGELINGTTSNASTGSYELYVGPYSDDMLVVAIDDAGSAPDFNAAVYDLVNAGL